VHLDEAKKRKRENTAINELVADLAQKVRADTMDGLFFELFSIGQAIGRSTDLQKLAAKIRADAADGPRA
jgi:hypothetical protein